MFLFERQNYGENEKQRSSIHSSNWPQCPGLSQEIPSKVLHTAVDAQELQPSSATFPRHKQGAGGSAADGT